MWIKTEGKPIVFYLCDMQRCERCTSLVDGLCKHTSDKGHAKYKDDKQRKFEQYGNALFEKERKANGIIR